MCFVLRRAVNTLECETARTYKLTMNAFEPITFIVPCEVRSLVALPGPHSRRVLLGKSRLAQIRLAVLSATATAASSTSFPSGPGPGPMRSVTASAPQSAQSPTSVLPIISPPLVSEPLPPPQHPLHQLVYNCCPFAQHPKYNPGMHSFSLFSRKFPVQGALSLSSDSSL